MENKVIEEYGDINNFIRLNSHNHNSTYILERLINPIHAFLESKIDGFPVGSWYHWMYHRLENDE